MSYKMYQLTASHRYDNDIGKLYYGSEQGVKKRVAELNALEMEQTLSRYKDSITWEKNYINDLERMIEVYETFDDETKRLLNVTTHLESVTYLRESLAFAMERISESKDKEIEPDRKWKFEPIDMDDVEMEQDV